MSATDTQVLKRKLWVIDIYNTILNSKECERQRDRRDKNKFPFMRF